MEKTNNNNLNYYPYNLLTDYFLRTSLKNEPKEYQIRSLFARDLIVPERIDLMAKWFYIDCKIKHMNMKDARELYLRHIEAFSCGTYVEEGTENKNSIQKYFEEFDNLIEDIKENGFDEKKTLVPIGEKNILLDGSHRCVCAAYFNQKIKVVKFKGLERNYNYAFFRERLLDNKYLDKMIYEYCKKKNNIYLACIWPKGNCLLSKEKSIEIIQDKCGVIIYCKRIILNYKGLYNLMIQAYGHQSWVGSYEDKHFGVKEKVDNCYKMGSPINLVFFECNDYKKVVQAKEKIRDMYKIGNHSIHITDNSDETCFMTELLLNENSINHMKYGRPDFSLETNKELLKLKELIKEKKMSIENFIISDNGIMNIYGLRRQGKLDYFTLYNSTDFKVLEKNGNNEDQIKFYDLSKNDLILNSNNYFVYNGIKFLSLSCLKKMKKNRNKNTDKVDVIKINLYLLLNNISIDYLIKIRNRYLRYKRLRPNRKNTILNKFLIILNKKY